MHLKKNELTIVCNSQHLKSKQTITLAKSLCQRVNLQDISHVRISVNLFCTMVARADISPKELINRAHPYYQKELRNRNFSDESWFYIIKNNPDLFMNPLVFYRDKGIICLTPTDILKVA